MHRSGSSLEEKKRPRLAVRSVNLSWFSRVEEESKKQRLFQWDVKIPSPGSSAEGKKPPLTPGCSGTHVGYSCRLQIRPWIFIPSRMEPSLEKSTTDALWETKSLPASWAGLTPCTGRMPQGKGEGGRDRNRAALGWKSSVRGLTKQEILCSRAGETQSSSRACQAAPLSPSTCGLSWWGDDDPCTGLGLIFPSSQLLVTSWSSGQCEEAK